ncbi:MAG: hypothetical protein C0404_07170 [Verrucomicrobia bacterium]|nr:hypothetical protein [Verrucomicrobiota bacterium]
MAGKPFFAPANMGGPHMAVSPDGKWLYAAGDNSSGHFSGGSTMHAVFRCPLEDDKPGAVFSGELNKPGSDNSHFNSVRGLDCDTQGRVYVCDHDNGRIQVFTPDGKHAKTIPIDRPGQVSVHRKSGSIYVMHTTRVQGASVNRISKLMSYEIPAVESFIDCPGGHMALDSWTAKPRLWIHDGNVRILEEDGKQFRKLADFAEEVKAEVEKAGGKHPGGWSGTTRAGNGKIACDPTREQVYFANSSVFDLKSGAWLGNIRLPGVIDDIAFDKQGYMHCHFNPGFYQQGVGRLDPGQRLRECPYDYGVDAKGWLGVIPVRDQPGAKFFQDGIGVNMRGDVAENCNIYYAPKRDDDAKEFSLAGDKEQWAAGKGNDADGNNFATFQADIQRRLKTGEEVYWIRPKPGVPLLGATIWTFNRNGELRDESAVITGGLINGVMIDEAGSLYLVNNRVRLFNGKPFLAGRGGIFGAGKDAKVKDPFTGSMIKVGRRGSILSARSPIRLEDPPARPPELTNGDNVWFDGAEWLYAGASPIMPGGCSCPTQRLHTDWYKRSFVPEKYRHSIGVVDTAGNLILHIGQYGNIDSGYGPASKVPVGGDGIAFSDARMLSGTDNYLCFSDRGERIVVLKLNYHAEASVSVQ